MGIFDDFDVPDTDAPAPEYVGPQPPPDNTEQLDPHDKGQESLYKRWGLSRFAASRWFSNSVQPTVQVDREWQDDDRLIYGYQAVASNVTFATDYYAAVAIFAGNLEVVVRGISAYASVANVDRVHVASVTEPLTYNPVIDQPLEWAPFLTTAPKIRLPQCAVFSGLNEFLPAINVGGSLFNPALGPFYRVNGSATSSSQHEAYELARLWDGAPFIIPPGGVLAVQAVEPGTSSNGHTYTVNVFLSEREVR